MDEQIERVENRNLYQMYQFNKMCVKHSNKPGTCIERQLWHGTTVEAVENICLYGFNRGYCGRNGTTFAAFTLSLNQLWGGSVV